MPLIIIIVLAVWLLKPARSTKRSQTQRRIAYTPPRNLPAPVSVIDPIKAQRERDRQADRARKLAEHQRKEAERIAKADEARRAAADEVIRTDSFLLQYRNLYDMIEQELNNPSLTEYKRIQLTEKLINLEQKIYRLEQKRNKAYFTAHN